MERNPHLLIEGCAIGCYAIGAKVAYIYIRGEFYHVQQVLERAIDEAYARGLPREEHPRLRLRLRRLRPPRRRRVRGGRGDGAARVARRQARAAAQQAAVPGGRRPLRLPDRRQQRRDALQRAAHPDATAPSGSRRSAPRRTAGRSSTASAATSTKPGVYEASMNVTLRRADLTSYAGGHARRAARSRRSSPAARRRRCCCPTRLDTQASFDGIAKAGSMLGSAAIDRARRHDLHGLARRRTCCTSTATSRAASARRAARATDWLLQDPAADRARRGADDATSTCCSSIAANIGGKTLCPFGDAAVAPVLSTLKHFRPSTRRTSAKAAARCPADWRGRGNRWARRISEALTRRESAMVRLPLIDRYR